MSLNPLRVFGSLKVKSEIPLANSIMQTSTINVDNVLDRCNLYEFSDRGNIRNNLANKFISFEGSRYVEDSIGEVLKFLNQLQVFLDTKEIQILNLSGDLRLFVDHGEQLLLIIKVNVDNGVINFQLGNNISWSEQQAFSKDIAKSVINEFYS